MIRFIQLSNLYLRYGRQSHHAHISEERYATFVNLQSKVLPQTLLMYQFGRMCMHAIHSSSQMEIATQNNETNKELTHIDYEQSLAFRIAQLVIDRLLREIFDFNELIRAVDCCEIHEVDLYRRRGGI